MAMAWTAAELAEMAASAAVHLLFGLYVFSSAVASDLSQALAGRQRDAGRDSATPPPPPPSPREPPVVMVHGIFGFGKERLGGLSYFGGAEGREEGVLVPDLGSLTSVHDRARQLFYYLKGGTVDYGEEHSKACGHSRYGRTYVQGHYPEWDDQHPVHFVGHSAGAQVVRVLQKMLSNKEFEGYGNTSEDWIFSLTSLSGALNGTTRAYMDGMQPDDGRSLKPICLLQLCRLGVIIYEWLDIKWLKKYYSFGFDHFEISWHKSGLRGLIDYLLGNAGPFASGDWILPDLTIQGALQMNSKLQTFPNTYYLSYATKITRKLMGHVMPSGLRRIHPLLVVRVVQMCWWHHPADGSCPYKGYKELRCKTCVGRRAKQDIKVMEILYSMSDPRFQSVVAPRDWDEDWQDNDGALNTVSMTHPQIPVEHPSLCVSDDSDSHPMKPGIWYYKILEADHLLFILSRERAGMQFDMLYDGIFRWCRKLAIRRMAPST